MAAARAAPAMAEAYGRLSSLAPSFKVVVELPKSYIPLKSESDNNQSPQLTAAELQFKQAIAKKKSYTLNIGGLLSIPSADARAKVQYSQPTTPASNLRDPFYGIPFRAFAESMGERIMPVVEAAKENHRQSTIEGRIHAENAQPVVPHVPHLLPFTRWAAKSESFRETLVVNKESHKKARLSWYHPDDTMVPRDWFKGGLMADLKYYMPFGYGSESSESSTSTVATA